MEVTSSVVLERAAPDVFGFIADMAKNPLWQRGQEECVWTSPPPHGVGSTYSQKARFMGKAIISEFEVVEFVPDRGIRFRSTSGTMPIDVTRSVEPIDDTSCTVEAVVRGEPAGLMGLLSPLTKWLVQASVRGDYRRLKALLESGA